MRLTIRGDLPQRFGPFYEVQEYIASGAFGEVYRAKYKLTDEVVALKVLQPQWLTNKAARRSLYREARIAHRCRVHLERIVRLAGERLDVSASIVRVVDSNRNGNVPYVAMEFVEGQPLDKAKGETGFDEPRRAAEIVRHLALALRGVHWSNYLHRDIKPGNVRLRPEGVPVLLDFGLAVELASAAARPTAFAGSRDYAPPEQIHPTGARLTPEADVYALGVTLYELFTGRLPFTASLSLSKDEYFNEIRRQTLNDKPKPPSEFQPDIDPTLDTICLKALAKRPEDRYRSMTEFAKVLNGWLDDRRFGPPPTGTPPAGEPTMHTAPDRPRVPRAAIRYAFLGLGSVAPPNLGRSNRLFLDVGNDLRPGVIDHHQITAEGGSSAGLIPKRLDYVDAAVGPDGAAGFTIVLHHDPDLDCVASAWLATHYLEFGTLPEGYEAVLRYVDRVDAGESLLTTATPHALYAAQRVLLARSKADSEVERWTAAVEEGIQLLDHVLARVRAGEPVDRVDAFAAPGLFSPGDREGVEEDVRKYEAKLADPRTNARVATLSLPGAGDGRREVDALLVRDVQNAGDLARCRFFKDWARGDVRNSARRAGFAALSVFHPAEAGRPQRCILSVAPGRGVVLTGLGGRLDAAEADRRRKRHGGRDDRVIDPATGLALDPRPGYDNADPWYDGRAHGFTIVDAPRSGTVLSADEIEQIFLDYGAAADVRPL